MATKQGMEQFASPHSAAPWRRRPISPFDPTPAFGARDVNAPQLRRFSDGERVVVGDASCLSADPTSGLAGRLRVAPGAPVQAAPAGNVIPRRPLHMLRPAGATLATVTIADLGMTCQQYLALSTVDQAHAVARATSYPDANWYVAVSAAAQIAQQCQTQLAEQQAAASAGSNAPSTSTDAGPSPHDTGSGAAASTSSKLPWIIGGAVVGGVALVALVVALATKRAE